MKSIHATHSCNQVPSRWFIWCHFNFRKNFFSLFTSITSRNVCMQSGHTIKSSHPSSYSPQSQSPHSGSYFSHFCQFHHLVHSAPFVPTYYSIVSFNQPLFAAISYSKIAFTHANHSLKPLLTSPSHTSTSGAVTMMPKFIEHYDFPVNVLCLLCALYP